LKTEEEKNCLLIYFTTCPLFVPSEVHLWFSGNPPFPSSLQKDKANFLENLKMPVIEPSDLKNVINAGVNAGAKDQCLPSLKQKEIGKKGNFSSICFFLLDIQN